MSRNAVISPRNDVGVLECGLSAWPWVVMRLLVLGLLVSSPWRVTFAPSTFATRGNVQAN